MRDARDQELCEVVMRAVLKHMPGELRFEKDKEAISKQREAIDDLYEVCAHTSSRNPPGLAMPYCRW